VDNVRYVTPPKEYDAIYALQERKGNCQNFSHLSAALMRAVGIPVRIVNGVTLNQPFNVSRQGGVLTFKMGQGRHSWIEVWFEDLGWVPFDAQQTELFVSNRYVRVEIGIDNKETINDGLLRWSQVSGSEGKPSLQESISADFASDLVKITGTPQQYGPKNLLLVPPVEATFKEIIVPPPPPPQVIPEKDRDKLRFLVPFLYGNLEFPENVDFAFSPWPGKYGWGQPLPNDQKFSRGNGRIRYHQTNPVRSGFRVTQTSEAGKNRFGTSQVWRRWAALG
jgi:hypothetical protein